MSRGRRGAAAAALAVIALSVVPSIGGQHFGLLEGDGLLFGLNASASASGQVGPVPAQISGFFFTGPAVDVETGVSVSTVSGCIQVQLEAGTDFGCIREMRIPVQFDPLLESATYNLNVPSALFRGSLIHVIIAAQSKPQGGDPYVNPDAEVINYPDFSFSVDAGFRRDATITGSVKSGGLGTGGEIDPSTLARLVRGVKAVACSHQGAPCP